MSSAFISPAVPLTSFGSRPSLSQRRLSRFPALPSCRRRAASRQLRMLVTEDDLRPSVGFTMYAEVINGRAAMLGFIAVLIIELVTGRGVIDIFQSLTGNA